MPRNDEFRVGVKYSNALSMPNRAKSVLKSFISKEMFDEEKYLKNEAYFFIISHNLFDEFMKFCKSYSGDPHKDAVNLLSNL